MIIDPFNLCGASREDILDIQRQLAALPNNLDICWDTEKGDWVDSTVFCPGHSFVYDPPEETTTEDKNKLEKRERLPAENIWGKEKQMAKIRIEECSGGYVVVTYQYSMWKGFRKYHNRFGRQIDRDEFTMHPFTSEEVFPDESSAESYVNRNFKTEEQVELDKQEAQTILEKKEQLEREILKTLKEKYE